MQGASLRGAETRSRGWTVTGAGGLLLTVVSLAVIAVVGGDHGRLPGWGAADASSFEPVEHPGDVAKQAAARAEEHSAGPSDDLTWPLHGAITGRFGEGRAGHRHEGIDIPMPAGTPIKAASGGRVVMREMESGYGKYTCIAHRTISTCYGHQSRFHTHPGARVRRGEVIGYVGNTGNSGAIHLHFEVRRGTRPWGTAVNPMRFLPQQR